MEFRDFLSAALIMLLAAGFNQCKEEDPSMVENINFTLTSPAFDDGAFIPAQFTCEGDDSSPALSWENVPAGTRSYALTCIDPDAPVGDWVHWLAWNIPGDSSSLPAGIDPQDQSTLSQGQNSWERSGYGGPCPPRGHGEHRYFFRLFALDVEELNVPGPGDRKALEEALEGHVLGIGLIMGRYGRD